MSAQSQSAWNPPAADKQVWTPPAADAKAASERSFADAAKDAGSAFWEWTGKPVAMALGLSGGSDAERAEKGKAAQDQIIKGIMNEPARVRQEATNALDAFVAGNPRATLHHVLSAIPVVGEGINQAAQEFNKGEYAKGIGHTAAILSPAAAREAPLIGEGAKALGNAAKEVAVSAVPEGARAAVNAVKGNLVDAATSPLTRDLVGVASPRLKNALGVVDRARQAVSAAKERMGPPAAAEPQPPPPAVDPALEALAQKSGFESYAAAPPEAQAFIKNMAAQSPAPVQRPEVAPTDVVSRETETPPTGPQTIQEMIQAEVAARQAAQPPVAAPSSPPIGIHRVVPPLNGRGVPIQPPLRQPVPAVAPPEPAQVAPAAQEPMVQPPAPPAVNPAAVSASRNPAELAKAAGLPANATPKEIAQAIYESMNRRGALPPTEVAPPATGDLTAGADLMREIPRPMRKAVADANYRAVKEGNAGPETAAPTYEAAARSTKVEPVVKALLDHGIKYSDLVKLTKPEIQTFVDKLSAATAAEGGAHPGNVFSKLSIDELLGEMRRAEGRGVRRIK